MMSEVLHTQQGAWSSGRAWLERKRRAVLLVMLVLMFVIAALAPRIFITVPSGHGGILWLRFFGGTQTSQAALGEGLHVIMPWDHVFIYDMRVQEREQSYQVMAREGLQITVRSSFRWQLNRATLARLHKEIGPNYLNVLLVPEIGSVVRERMSQYNTEELFSSRRTEIQAEILRAVVAESPGQASNRIGGIVDAREGFVTMSEDFVTLTDVLLKDVTLPFRVRSAVERKLEQAQITQEYSFRIEREKLESQRKQIEAQGIQAFQQTVQAGISENYLKWRGIEATLQLAQSPNSKVVIVGGGSNGLPLILNTEDTAKAPSAPVAPANPVNPVKVQKASAENGTRTPGSIDATPPQTNAMVDELITPGSSKRGSDAIMRLGLPASDVLSKAADDEPPYILRSFADAFGYRLQKISPFTAEVIRESERPR
jgi:regulator of protease activity HflC (stomatin/prohibitin superfamily)